MGAITKPVKLMVSLFSEIAMSPVMASAVELVARQ